ncbi:Retrovirus-related Pol poly from transposon, partial [Brachionus plicatilis]
MEGSFGSFNPDIDISSVGTRWTTYKIRFENYMPKDRFKHRVNYVKEQTEEQGSDIGYVFSVSDDNRALPVITIDIGDNKVKTEVLIDTGSSLNIIDKQTYKRLKPKPVLEVVKGKVFGFQNSCPLVFAGEFRTLIGNKDKLVEAKIAVVNGTERCLLGYKTASDLEAKGPTKWLLPAMLVPKSDGKLRFVIDASAANRAIKRTRYVMPTIEDLIADINGSTI